MAWYCFGSSRNLPALGSGTRPRRCRTHSRCAAPSAPAAQHRAGQQLDDLVALHHVEADPGDAAVRLVVHEQVAAVIGAVGERGVRMVEIAVEIDATAARQELPGLGLQPLGQDLAALVGLPPARGAAAVEDRDAHQLAHRRQAHDPDLAGLAAREEDVILIQLADADGVLLPFAAAAEPAGSVAVKAPSPPTPATAPAPTSPAVWAVPLRRVRRSYLLLAVSSVIAFAPLASSLLLATGYRHTRACRP